MRWERLAAIGLLAVALGGAAIYALIAWVSTPAHGDGGIGVGGIDAVQFQVTLIACAIPALAVIATALAEAMNMLGAAKREPNRGRL
jgi:hypothetical protein